MMNSEDASTEKRSGRKPAAPIRVLIQACSRRKSGAADLLPAVARYDGTSFRVIAKYRREETATRADEPRLLILSAEFGLIGAEHAIPDYDRRMNRRRAAELSTPVLRQWRELIGGAQVGEVFVNCGKDYLPALRGLLAELPSGTRTTYAAGGIGEKNSQLKKWLRAGKEKSRRPPNSASPPEKRITDSRNERDDLLKKTDGESGAKKPPEARLTNRLKYRFYLTLTVNLLK